MEYLARNNKGRYLISSKVIVKSKLWYHCPAHMALLTSAREKNADIYFAKNYGLSCQTSVREPLVVQAGTARGSINEKLIS